MSAEAFVVCMGLGAAALALWFDTRFPALAPTSLRSALIRLGAAFAVMQIPVVTIDGSELAQLVLIFMVYLPMLSYAFLAAIWMVKTTTGLMNGLR
jgi:hypothetical protein